MQSGGVQLTSCRHRQPRPRITARGAVRRRLARREVRGLTRDEVGEPVGNALNHNLLLELLLSTTLVPPDLRLVD